jgi:hypothetical protein
MADENKPAFYPRVGRNIAKNFRSAQPPAFIEDPRAMDLPEYGDVDLSVPSQANLEMSRRMAQRQADLKRQQERDRSPLEKVAGALQTGRLMGSALTQAINSMPTRIAKGDEAADKFMQERMYQPTQPTAYEYAEDIGDMLGRLETEYKIPPILPEAMALQFLTGPATSQAARATGRGAEQVGRKLESAMEPVVRGALEQGGLPREMAMAMGQGTRSYAHLPHTEKSPDPTVGTRYKRTDIGGLVPRKDLDIEKLDKSSVKVFPWDASDRNKLVTEVSDIPLTNPVLLEGGDNYMRDLKHVKKRIAGASNEGIANRIQSRIDNASVENQILGGTGKVFGFPIRMGDKAEHASTFPTDIAMDLLKQGNLSRKELDELTNELRGMAFEAKGKGYFQNVAPVDSPEFLTQLREGLKADKEKGISGVTDMNLRRALMDRLSQKKYQKRLEYNYPDLINSVIADELKGIPKGYVGNVSAELDPFSKIRPSKSSTYSHDFGGKYFASMPDMPVEFLMPNTYEGIYLEMKALYPKAKPEALRNMTIGAMEKRKDKISEMIGPRSIDAVKSYQEGLKKGEFDPNNIKEVYDYMRRQKLKLKFAEGGEVSGDDLILEERPL